MASSLDLSLPEAPRSKARAGFVQWLTLISAAAAVVLLVLARTRIPSEPAKVAEVELDRMKKLAADLERRTLYAQAADVWGEYMAAADLKAADRARTLYRRGKCLKEGGRPAEAARLLTEVDLYDNAEFPRDEKLKARQLLLECLSSLGKQDAREAVARAFAVGGEEKGTVVARVGTESITKEELRGEIKQAALEMLRLQGAPLKPEELEAKAGELADQQLKDPEAQKKAVMQAVSARVLYEEGLQRGFADEPATADAISRFRRQFIANRVVESEVETAMKALGPTELQNHYDAHKETFKEKAGTEFSFARFPGPAEAEAAIGKLRDPAKAGDVKMEKAPGPAVEGEPVPEVGPSAEAAAQILALGEGEVSKQPVEHGGAYFVFRAEKKRPERQLAYAEAEPRVRADLARLKRKEALESLQKLLTQKFSVEVLPP